MAEQRIPPSLQPIEVPASVGVHMLFLAIDSARLGRDSSTKMRRKEGTPGCGGTFLEFQLACSSFVPLRLYLSKFARQEKARCDTGAHHVYAELDVDARSRCITCVRCVG